MSSDSLDCSSRNPAAAKKGLPPHLLADLAVKRGKEGNLCDYVPDARSGKSQN
jgi:hypothetical protein